VKITSAGIPVRGVEIDSRTGCAHYRSGLDIVAIKFSCCQSYYACFYCHQAEAGHPARIWRRAQFNEKAVLCGACGAELAIHQYLHCQVVCPMIIWLGLQSALRVASPFVLRNVGLQKSAVRISECSQWMIG
jgi:uncharacterized CHY-type Zn-finger protein